jgi:hypothetical protein
MGRESRIYLLFPVDDFLAAALGAPPFFGIAFNGVGGPANAPASIFFNLVSVSEGFMAFDPQKHPAEYQPTVISKLAAGRRQLNCAIELWFKDADQVSVHTLAVAAHQIIHDIHEAKFPEKPLLLNTPIADEKRRGEFILIFKEAANFFKHAERDPNPGSSVEFAPFLTQMFFLYSIVGLSNLGEALTDTEASYSMWFSVNHPEFMNAQFVERMTNAVPGKDLKIFRGVKKREFLEGTLQAQLNARMQR